MKSKEENFSNIDKSKKTDSNKQGHSSNSGSGEVDMSPKRYKYDVPSAFNSEISKNNKDK